MTLVVGAIGDDSIGLLTDRRLCSRGRAVRDDAFKAVCRL